MTTKFPLPTPPAPKVDAVAAWVHALATVTAASEAIEQLRALGPDGIQDAYRKGGIRLEPMDRDGILEDLDGLVYMVERVRSTLHSSAPNPIPGQADRIVRRIIAMRPERLVARKR